MTLLSTIAYIGLGSNLSEPIEQVKNAVKQIEKIAQSQVTAVSSLYLSKPKMERPQDKAASGSIK